MRGAWGGASGLSAVLGALPSALLVDEATSTDAVLDILPSASLIGWAAPAGTACHPVL